MFFISTCFSAEYHLAGKSSVTLAGEKPMQEHGIFLSHLSYSFNNQKGKFYYLNKVLIQTFN